MSHELKTERSAPAFIANDGKPGWHRIGEARYKDQTFADAISEIMGGATYSVEPLATFRGGADGGFQLVPNQFQVIMRDPTATDQKIRSFGTVSKDFRIETPDRIAELLGPVLDDAGYRVHTAGMLRNGSSIFVAMKIGEAEVVGEHHEYYLTLDLSYEPGRTMKVYLTTIRTVCANTQLIGLERAALDLHVSHTGDVGAKFALATEFVRGIDQRKSEFEAFMEALAGYAVNKAETERAIKAAIPTPSRPKSLSGMLDKLTEADIVAFGKGSDAIADLLEDLSSKERAYVNSVARSQAAREAVQIALDDFNREHKAHAGTAYAVYNAITQTADWREGRGDLAQIGESALIGSRMREKVRGAEALAGIVGV